MLRRRKNMSAQEHHKAEKSLLDDDVMEQVIRDADFIPLLSEEMRNTENQMAPLENPQNLFGRVNAGGGDSRDPDKDLIFPEGMQVPTRKRKVGDGGFLASKQKKVAIGV
ncbi:MAG: hypothetical protein L6R41_008382 [Letrouitia leprolyta]|nr:MAG: hypothetical protein L6R41_008382 [Letrouitia leprolyta]